jgi:hypothetical protein
VTVENIGESSKNPFRRVQVQPSSSDRNTTPTPTNIRKKAQQKIIYSSGEEADTEGENDPDYGETSQDRKRLLGCTPEPTPIQQIRPTFGLDSVDQEIQQLLNPAPTSPHNFEH